MQKYKLINLQTKGEHLCDKVTIDGFNYYVSDEEIKESDWYLAWETINNIESNHIVQKATDSEPVGMYSWASNYKKVIATNNPNIDILKVVDEVEMLAREFATKTINPLNPIGTITCFLSQNGFEKGYNKSQETHPFSEEDVKEIFKIAQMQKNYGDYKPYTFEEAIQLWKEQQTKIVYYNE